MEGGGEGAHEHRLAEAGQPFEQQVAVGQQGDERVAYDVALPDDDASDFGFDFGRDVAELAGG